MIVKPDYLSYREAGKKAALKSIYVDQFVFFEERLPSFETPIKRYRITFGQIGEFMIIASILWAANLIPLIKEALP